MVSFHSFEEPHGTKIAYMMSIFQNLGELCCPTGVQAKLPYPFLEQEMLS